MRRAQPHRERADQRRPVTKRASVHLWRGAGRRGCQHPARPAKRLLYCSACGRVDPIGQSLAEREPASLADALREGYAWLEDARLPD